MTQQHCMMALNVCGRTQYLHMRFLKDNYDFASAYLTSVQVGG